jgi:hypothetical protein
MTADCGGNIHEKNVVTITSSGDLNYRHAGQVFRVANHGWDKYWQSSNAPNSWICFDFKEQSIALTHYTLKSPGGGGCFPLMWAIESSNDGSDWTALDERNTRELVGPSVVKSFECSKNCSEFFRYIRIRLTGRDSSGYDCLMLTNIEFFGRLR